MTVYGAQAGGHYEDFAVGDVFRHPSGRTVCEPDNALFTLLNKDGTKDGSGAGCAGHLPNGKAVVNSGLTVALVLRQSVLDQTVLMNLGWTDIRLNHPVFVGDTLYAESQITDMHDSPSRSDAGIVTARTRGLNQHGDEVVSWTRTLLVHKRRVPTA